MDKEYNILKKLGQGGYASVYKVRHKKLGYTRAMRVLNAVITDETDSVYQKFLNECRLLLRLGNGCNPNIVHVCQPLLKNQRAMVEMDFVDGEDLFHYIGRKEGFVPIADVIQLLKDIGGALAYCHVDIYKHCMNAVDDGLECDPDDAAKYLIDDAKRQELINKYRVIHNDIHSGNIMHRESGDYILLDFGLAIESDEVVRSSCRKNGAPEYKSPEKWENDNHLSTQSDIYSFGVVLYEMLTGNVPFAYDKSNKNSAQAEYLLSLAHLREAPKPIFNARKAAYEKTHPGSQYKKDYPDWLEELVMKCLEKKPSDRFADGKEMQGFFEKSVDKYNAGDLENANKKLNEELSSLQLKNRLLENENSNLKKILETFKNKAISLTVLKEGLERKVAESEKENSFLLKEKVSLIKETSKLAEENKTLKCAVEELTSEYNKLKVAASVFDDNYVELRKEITALRTVNNTQRERIAVLEQELNSSENEVAEQDNNINVTKKAKSVSGRNKKDEGFVKFVLSAFIFGLCFIIFIVLICFLFFKVIGDAGIYEMLKFYGIWMAGLILVLISGNYLSNNCFRIGLKRYTHGDYISAFKYIKWGAWLEHEVSQFYLAKCYEEGRGVKRSIKKAAKWYRFSAKLDYVQSQIKIGSFYEFGHGVKKSREKALMWYRKAAKNGANVENRIRRLE